MSVERPVVVPAQRSAPDRAVGPIPRRPHAARAPLSFSQLQIWVLDRLNPGNPAYGLPFAFRLSGALDVAALEYSFNHVIERHEILRTTFSAHGEPLQYIHDACRIDIRRVDLRDLPVEQCEAKLHALATEEARRSFDLEALPLVRVVLFAVDADAHVLLVNMHHIVGDGVSIGVLLDELDASYRFFTGAGPRPAASPVQYADFAAWQRDTFTRKDYARQIAFWRRQLEGRVAPLDVAADAPRPAVQSFNGSNVFFSISKELTKALTVLGSREGCTLYMTVLAAFQILLQRYASSDEFVVGSPVTLRSAPEARRLIGNFLNMLPLRCDLTGEPTFVQLLSRTRRTVLQALMTADFPFSKIVESVTFDRDPGRNPIFQVMFELLGSTRSSIADVQVRNFFFDLGFAQFDLSLHAWEEADRYACRFEYNADLFKADTVQRMADNFITLLSAIVADPNRSIASLPILSEAERSLALERFNGTAAPYRADTCVHQLVEEAALASRDRVAVECGGRALTYRELNEAANRVAHALLKSGVQPDGCVGVFLDRSVDLVVALLGVLKAGAAYVPLDPHFPAERLAFMLDDANAAIVLTDSTLRHAVPQAVGRTLLCVDEDAIRREPATNPQTVVRPSDLAYIIYTSGSSGRPKGVMIEHRALTNLLTAMQRRPGLTREDVLVGVTTVSFDIAALEIFLPLISGARLVLTRSSEAGSGSTLIDLIARAGATVVQATPSTWKLLLDANWRGRPGLKMLCGGEPLPPVVAKGLIGLGGELWNMYGPTETTIWSSSLRIDRADGVIPIGPPIANTRFYVVDGALQPVPIGVPGELLIGGDGVARGYRGREDLTRERFVEAPFLPGHDRVYRTGDRVKLRPDGRLEFLGRFDFQVKVRGYRIELQEVEQALIDHPSIKEAVVISRADRDGDHYLAAYFIGVNGTATDPAELRQHLKRRLPDYMCPSVFMSLDAFPLTPNGKIDRNALPDPNASVHRATTSYAAPNRDMEKRLTAIWEETLNRRPIGIDDDFFEVGGHSLLAARLFTKIESRLGLRMPLAVLFRAPTIRKLAGLIGQEQWTSSWHSLVPIQPLGRRAPLFLVHGAEGNVLLYRNLAESLGNDQPVYGLQSRGLNSADNGASTIEVMGADYVREIRSVQPHGPYHVGGYCLGGTIALEIARQLKAAGEPVALVAMIESYNVQSEPPASALLRTVHKLENLYFQAGNLLLSSSASPAAFFTEKLRVEVSRWQVHAAILWSKALRRLDTEHTPLYQHLAVRDANHRAQAAYRPRAYDGPITLFRPRVHFRGFTDRCFGWGTVARGGVRVVEMPNFPRGSLNKPFVALLARRLESLLGGTGEPGEPAATPALLRPLEQLHENG